MILDCVNAQMQAGTTAYATPMPPGAMQVRNAMVLPICYPRVFTLALAKHA